MTKRDVKRKVRASIDMLLNADRHLFEVDANERAITHKLAEHLKGRFRGWDVDCEYNRNQDMPKLLNLPIRNGSSRDTNARTVYPDIVVHRRNTENNLLVIEVKKTSSRVSDETDLAKLGAFVKQLGYRHAVFVKFHVGCQKRGFTQNWLRKEK